MLRAPAVEMFSHYFTTSLIKASVHSVALFLPIFLVLVGFWLRPSQRVVPVLCYVFTLSYPRLRNFRCGECIRVLTLCEWYCRKPYNDHCNAHVPTRNSKNREKDLSK